MSATEACSTATTCALSARWIVSAAPSLALTDSALPSSFSIVPRTRMVCCAAAVHTIVAASAAAAAIRSPIVVTDIAPSVGYIGGVTPRPTLTAGVCSVPSGCLVAPKMMICAPGLSSLRSPGA